MKFLAITNVFLTIILFPSTLGAHFRFTNFKCISLDPEFAVVKECILKMVRRSVVGINFHIAIKYSQPINKIEFNLSIFRKSNMYRLFLVNHTIDFCYYMRRPEQYPIFYMFHDSLMAATNANHSCPYTVSTNMNLNCYFTSSNTIFYAHRRRISMWRKWLSTIRRWRTCYPFYLLVNTNLWCLLGLLESGDCRSTCLECVINNGIVKIITKTV